MDFDELAINSLERRYKKPFGDILNAVLKIQSVWRSYCCRKKTFVQEVHDELYFRRLESYVEHLYKSNQELKNMVIRQEQEMLDGKKELSILQQNVAQLQKQVARLESRMNAGSGES